MRWKYYLRGLGLGILVSTLFLMISIQLHGGIMTDERVIARAKQLGMVIPEDGETDTQTPEEKSQKPDDTVQSDVSLNDTQADDAAQNNSQQVDIVQDDAQPDDAAQNDTTSDDATQNDAGQNSTAQEDILFTVTDGEVCRTAAEKLLACGLIEDVDAFREYMKAHDYDGLIREGTYRIPVGADTDTIARIITAQVPEAMVKEEAATDSP